MAQKKTKNDESKIDKNLISNEKPVQKEGYTVTLVHKSKPDKEGKEYYYKYNKIFSTEEIASRQKKAIETKRKKKELKETTGPTNLEPIEDNKVIKSIK